FTLTGDLAGGEQVLLDLDDLGTADFHNGGANAVSYAVTSTTATTTASILAVPTNVSFVQANDRSVNARSNALSLAAATTTGNLLVVGIAWSGGSSLSSIRGASTTNPLDVMAQRTGSSGSVTSGTAVTTSANDQVVGFCVSDGTCSAGSGFTARLTNNNRLVEDRTQATAGSVAATGSATRSWVMIMAAFRPQ
ncbi:MAG TPA: hypothetical protein VLD58_03635, partial [Gemmatimonadales bacterium]|nr:hypothetical protein [Gemmatimonadales bacterium]